MFDRILKGRYRGTQPAKLSCRGVVDDESNWNFSLTELNKHRVCLEKTSDCSIVFLLRSPKEKGLKMMFDWFGIFMVRRCIKTTLTDSLDSKYPVGSMGMVYLPT